MEPQKVRMGFHAVRNNGGIDLSIVVDGRTVAVLRLSASELEDMAKAISEALNGDEDDGEPPSLS
jgi:hypothetical protein